MAGKNQGEGDRESAGRYNKAQQDFMESGKVGKAAREVKKRVTAEDLEAEAKGMAKAKEFDPEEARDYHKPIDKE